MYVWVSAVTGEPRAVARRLLVEAGAMLLGRPAAAIRIGCDPLGAPQVQAGADESLRVSVSHSRGVVAVAASRYLPVGVDVERGYPVTVAGLAGRWFDPQEVAWLDRQPPGARMQAFLLLWTAKEAAGKALGVGLRGGGLRRRMPPPLVGAGWRSVPGEHRLRVAHPAVADDAVLAVAVLDGGPETVVAVLDGGDETVVAVLDGSP